MRSVIRLLTLLVVLIPTANAQTMTKESAFSLGATTGKSSAGKLSPNGAGGTSEITEATAQDKIEGYTNSSQTSSYWNGNATTVQTLVNAGSAQKAKCADPNTVPANSRDAEHCHAVNALQNTSDKLRSGDVPESSRVNRSDPLLAQSDAIANNPQAVAGAMEGNYSNCTTITKMVTPDPIPDSCQQYRTEVAEVCNPVAVPLFGMTYVYQCKQETATLTTASCATTTNVTVGTTYNYSCQTKSKTEGQFNCSNRLTVTCDVAQNNCDPSTVMGFGSAPANMSFTNTLDAATGDFLLDLNSTASLASGTNDRTWTFTVSDKTKVAKFLLDRVIFEDWVWIRINGNTVLLGPLGTGDRIEVRPYGTGEMVFCDPGTSPCGQLDLGSTWTRNPGVDLTAYLVNGTNTISIRTIVGNSGSTSLRIRARGQCPSACTDLWVNDCSTYQARAQ